jgi:Arc/MetJ-type ribon-helix-helix transcriptional regulator
MKRISIHLDISIVGWIDANTDNRSHFIREAILREYYRQMEIENEIAKRAISLNQQLKEAEK